MLQDCIGQRLYNSSAKDAGIIVGIDIFNKEVCFVVDESTSPYFSNGTSLGKYWQVSRLNHEIWIGKTTYEVIDAIVTKAKQIEDSFKRQAQLDLIRFSKERQTLTFTD